VLNNTPYIIDLPRIFDPRGNLTYIEEENHLPFKIRRVYWIYDVPGGEARGAHAHKKCHQFIVAASGSFEVELDDGKNIKLISLNRPFYGLHIPPSIWAHEMNFSGCLMKMII
jgi:hypothetical protein